MKFILDFDRVLFDTDAFSTRLREEGLGDLPRGQELLLAIEEKGIDWKEFIPKGVIEFLNKYGNQCEIVSSYISTYRGDNTDNLTEMEQFQIEKIKRCGIGELVHNKVHVVDENKRAKLKELKETGDRLVFIDDSPKQTEVARELGYEKVVWLATAKELFTNPKPEMAPSYVAEMKEGIETVTSFSDFVRLSESWEKEQTIQ